MAHPLRLQRKRTKGFRLPSGTVSTVRPGKWGNPFRTAAAFRRWLDTGDWTIADLGPRWFVGEQEDGLDQRRRWMLSHLAELRGRILVCWCPPEAACHADVLCELANLPKKGGDMSLTLQITKEDVLEARREGMGPMGPFMRALCRIFPLADMNIDAQDVLIRQGQEVRHYRIPDNLMDCLGAWFQAGYIDKDSEPFRLSLIDEKEAQRPVLALDVDMEEKRALHRVLRALHDGDCPNCHILTESDNIDRREGHMRCKTCGFFITMLEASAIQFEFSEYMNRAVGIFYQWRIKRETEARERGEVWPAFYKELKG